jgi:hypothetical protein
LPPLVEAQTSPQRNAPSVVRMHTPVPPLAQLQFCPLFVVKSQRLLEQTVAPRQVPVVLSHAVPAVQHWTQHSAPGGGAHGVVPAGQHVFVAANAHDSPPAQQKGAPVGVVPHIGPGLHPQNPFVGFTHGVPAGQQFGPHGV